MVVMNNCCCCKVRTACLIFGGFALFGSLIQVSNDAKDIYQNITMSRQDQEWNLQELYELSNMDGLNMGTTKDEIRNFLAISFYFSVTDLFLSIAIILAASFLIYGVLKENSNYLVPTMIVCPLDLFVIIICVLIHSINLGFLHPISLAMNIVLCCGVVFDIFIWLCVYSHWQQLKAEDQSDLQNKPSPQNEPDNAVSSV
eukprot:GFUD01098063.1.p1 GENE.GFUD01098063.1~~GFUD01098063.1.p1  ORF type:complete len:200 (-),score=12.50 GFUD01098063.1:140-739(-)